MISKYLIVICFIFLIAGTTALNYANPSLPKLEKESVTDGNVYYNLSWNETYADEIYVRLDGTNEMSGDLRTPNLNLTEGDLTYINFDANLGLRSYSEGVAGYESLFVPESINGTTSIYLVSTDLRTGVQPAYVKSKPLDVRDPNEAYNQYFNSLETNSMKVGIGSGVPTISTLGTGDLMIDSITNRINIGDDNLTTTGAICDNVGCIGTTNNIFNQVLNTTSDVTFNKVSIGSDGAAITQSSGNPTILGDTGITFASAQTYSPFGIAATPGISFIGNGSSGMFLNNTGVGISDVGTVAAFFNTGGSRVYSAFRADSLALTTDLPVSEGGTGASSFNARGVVLGGTTTTGALQSLVNPTSATTGFHVLMHSGSSGNSVWSGLKFKNSAGSGNIFYASGNNYSDNDESLKWDHGIFGLHIKDPIMLFNSSDAGEDDWIIKNEDGNLFIRNIDRNGTVLQFNEAGGMWINETTNITQSLIIGGSYKVNSSTGISGSWNCTSFPNVTIVGGIITAWGC